MPHVLYEDAEIAALCEGLKGGNILSLDGQGLEISPKGLTHLGMLQCLLHRRGQIAKL